MIVDDVALYTTFSRGILRSMADAGVEILPYNTPLRYAPSAGPGTPPGGPQRQDAVKRRYHEKYLVVDGTRSCSAA